jgi:hypothetical protein
MGSSSNDKTRSFGMWLKAAIICGGLPLVAGLILCGLYLTVATDKGYESAWMGAGLTIIFVGIVLFGLGLIALCVYFFKGRREGLEMRKLVENCILTLLLLSSNFPVALACTWVANYEMSAYHLTFKNESSEPVEDILVTWPGGSHPVAVSLHSLESVQFKIRVTGEGPIEYTSRHGGESCEGVLAGYITSGLGGSLEVSFLDGCEFKATER